MVIPKKENLQKLEKKTKQSLRDFFFLSNGCCLVSLFAFRWLSAIYLRRRPKQFLYCTLYKVEKEKKWESSGTGGTRPTKMDIYERPA
jgi:hypothetical protein